MFPANQEISHQDLVEEEKKCGFSCNMGRDIYLALYPFIYFKIQSSASYLAKISQYAKTCLNSCGN